MQIPILKGTHEKLKKEISELKKEITGNSKDIGEAAALGDLKENSAYHSAKEKQVWLLEKMQRLKSYLNCRIIEVNSDAPEKVAFGTSVTVHDEDQDETHIFNIVGPVEFELDLLPDMATVAAPIARLLMGKKPGDTIECKFGNNTWSGVIREIRRIE
jgi:transcription elongation factor GreA